MWYLDPTTVIFALANTDMTVPDAEKTRMAQKLYAMGRPEGYDFDRKNNTGFMPAKELFLQDMQPSLDLFVTPESWLAFEMLGHSKGQVKWMLYPLEHWDIHRSGLPGVQGLRKEHCRGQRCWRKGSEGSSRFSYADHQRNQASEDACGKEQTPEVS